jgi:hypothetical protein
MMTLEAPYGRPCWKHRTFLLYSYLMHPKKLDRIHALTWNFSVPISPPVHLTLSQYNPIFILISYFKAHFTIIISSQVLSFSHIWIKAFHEFFSVAHFANFIFHDLISLAAALMKNGTFSSPLLFHNSKIIIINPCLSLKERETKYLSLSLSRARARTRTHTQNDG